MGKKKKYYVVWEGVEPGIYDSWAACQQNIKGYPGARYKSFPDRTSAEEAYGSTALDYVSEGKKKKEKKGTTVDYMEEIMLPSWSVDAACSGNPGQMEYRGVLNQDNTELFRFGPVPGGTNNIGEFLAIVHALALLKKEGNQTMPIYSDSRTGMIWVKKKKANTQLKKTKGTVHLYKLIRRAEEWLKKNTYKNPILKWETKRLGEIPADFGRK
ncbi:MAG: ribonuclease H [Saprospiraceae bacterium]|nr:ribonuclease H [Saprospiraceae bacterium]